MLSGNRLQGPALLESRQLTVGIGQRVLVRALDLVAYAGTITCILGRNGTGKTLTLHTLAGIRSPQAGEVRLKDRELGRWPHKQFAREVALLTQDSEDPFPATVLETTLVGRHPHIGFWAWEKDSDNEKARQALRAVDLEDLASREVATLSGGERRRAAIAAVLAQEPAVFLLDEPTNHLDPGHQLAVLELLRGLATNGCAVILSLHDAGQAARFADHVLLLFGEGEWQSGPTGEVLNAENVSRLYQTPVTELTWRGGRTFVTG